MGFLKEDFNKGSEKACQEAEGTRERKGALDKPIRVIASEGLKVTFEITASQYGTFKYVKQLKEIAKGFGAKATSSGKTVVFQCPNDVVAKAITKVWK